ncbi:MAG TPA: DUF1217 domain-containing protein [Methylovirgula sp.]
MLTATVLYNSIAQDYTKSLKATAKEPTVARATQYFVNNISKVTTASQLVNNSQLYNYVMTAFGLQDMTNAKALITKVLNGGAGSNGFAASLNDPRYITLVTAFDFAANGASTTSGSDSQAAATTVNNYYQQSLETQTGKENQGAQMALYFARMVPEITNPFAILADTTLLSVFETAFNLPTSFSEQDISVQANTVSKLLNIGKLSNATYQNQFLQRFTAMYDSQHPTSTVSTNPTNALLVSSPGISSDLLLSLANLKLGGS